MMMRRFPEISGSLFNGKVVTFSAPYWGPPIHGTYHEAAS